MEMHITLAINGLLFILNFAVGAGFLLRNQFPLIINPVITTIFFLAIITLEKLTSFKLKNYIRFLLVLTLVSHSLFGEYYRAYYTTAYFDNALHFFGTFTFSLLAFDLMSCFLKVYSPNPKILIFVIVFLSGTTLGVFFELIEFFLDELLKERNQFGLTDTNLDLFYDAIGALLAGIYMSLKQTKFLKEESS